MPKLKTRKPDPLDNPFIWRAFLQRLSGYDPACDWELIEVDPKRVWLKLKPQMFSASATRH